MHTSAGMFFRIAVSCVILSLTACPLGDERLANPPLAPEDWTFVFQVAPPSDGALYSIWTVHTRASFEERTASSGCKHVAMQHSVQGGSLPMPGSDTPTERSWIGTVRGQFNPDAPLRVTGVNDEAALGTAECPTFSGGFDLAVYDAESPVSLTIDAVDSYVHRKALGADNKEHITAFAGSFSASNNRRGTFIAYRTHVELTQARARGWLSDPWRFEEGLSSRCNLFFVDAPGLPDFPYGAGGLRLVGDKGETVFDSDDTDLKVAFRRNAVAGVPLGEAFFGARADNADAMADYFEAVQNTRGALVHEFSWPNASLSTSISALKLPITSTSHDFGFWLDRVAEGASFFDRIETAVANAGATTPLLAVPSCLNPGTEYEFTLVLTEVRDQATGASVSGFSLENELPFVMTHDGSNDTLSRHAFSLGVAESVAPGRYTLRLVLRGGSRGRSADIERVKVLALQVLPAQTTPPAPTGPTGSTGSMEASFFVTSSPSGAAFASLGGLAGADQRCKLAATAALGQSSAARSWRAFLTDTRYNSQVTAQDRVGSGPWFNRAGVMVSAEQLWTGIPETTLLDEYGAQVSADAWILTGTPYPEWLPTFVADRDIDNDGTPDTERDRVLYLLNVEQGLAQVASDPVANVSGNCLTYNSKHPDRTTWVTSPSWQTRSPSVWYASDRVSCSGDARISNGLRLLCFAQ